MRGREPNLLQQLPRMGAALCGRGQSMDREWFGKNLRDGQAWVQTTGCVLEHHLHGPRHRFAVGRRCWVVAEDADAPRGRPNEPHNSLGQRALARPALAHQAKRFASRNAERDAIDRAQLRAPQTMWPEHDREVFNLERRQGSPIHRADALSLAGAACEQCRRIGVGRRSKNLRRRPGLHHLAMPHYRYPLGDALDHRQIMRDEQHRKPTPCLQRRQQRQDLRLHRCIQRGGWFIRDQQRRIGGQSHGDHHALLLAARKLVREGSSLAVRIGQADFGQGVMYPARDLGLWQASMGGDCLGDLRANPHRGIEAAHRLLEDHADACPAACAPGAF